MALFAVYCIDKARAMDVRMANRPAHLEWARNLEERIRVAGPLMGDDGETFAGSLFIIEGDSKAELELLFAGDPYIKAGLFERVEIRPFKWLLGAGKP